MFSIISFPPDTPIEVPQTNTPAAVYFAINPSKRPVVVILKMPADGSKSIIPSV